MIKSICDWMSGSADFGKSGATAILVCAVQLLVMPSAVSQPLRTVELLESGWQKRVVENVTDTPPSEGWEPAKVPAAQWVDLAASPKALWYQRIIAIPADLGNKRVIIDLRGARLFPRIYVDGVLAGSGSDGWSPSIVDITSLVQAGKQHQLAVRCLNRSSCFAPEFVYKHGMSDAEMVGKTIAPVGGYKDLIGLADLAYLRILPASYVDQSELVIETSTRTQSLGVKGLVRNPAPGASVRVDVLDGDKQVLRSEPATVKSDGTFELKIAFPNARTWSPEDPHRYDIKLTLLNNGVAVDEFSQKFGFKEIWTDGPDFYLNGVKRHFLASSTWPGSDYTDAAEVRSRVKQIRDCNTVAFRLHIGFWPETWLDAADELGVLIIDEAAVYTDGGGMYAYRDPRFWENYRRHVEGIIRRGRNRPSLAMWSLGNEILFMGCEKFDPELPKKLGDLGRFAKTVDSLHPLTFEADLDPDGAYDVIGLHYPHEMPWNRDYPNTADWLGTTKNTEASGGMLGKQRKLGFFWDRKKPLYIGEYLWVPQNDYSCASIWYGDIAFQNRDEYHGRARNSSWHDQTIAYRRAGVSGTTPWTSFTHGAKADTKAEIYTVQQDYYRPQAAYFRTRGLRYFSGASAELVFDVFNDSPKKSEMELRFGPSTQAEPPATGATFQAESVHFTLEPATHREVKLTIQCPAVNAEQQLAVESVLLADGKPVHTQQRTLKLYPKSTLRAPDGNQLVIFDPAGKWDGSVRELRPELLLPPEKTVLLLAERTLVAGGGEQQKNLVGQIRTFVLAGGKAVLLEQDTLTPLGLGLKTVERPSTMTFPLAQTHPVLAGLDRADLTYWGENNYVTAREIDRTAAHGLSAISVSGGADWTRYAGIAEMPLGRGRIVLVQSLAGALRDVEPAAARIIQNSINYLSAKDASPAVAVSVLDSSDRIRGPLEKMGVAIESGVSNPMFLMLSGDGNRLADKTRDLITSTLAKGGTVYWHSPDPEAFASVRSSLLADQLEVVESSVGATLIDRENPLLRGVSREDVIATTKVENWNRTMRHTPNATGRYLQTRELGESESLPLAAASSRNVRIKADSVEFDEGGDMTFAVARAAKGIYQLEVSGSDTSKDAPSSLMIRVNNIDQTWIKLKADAPLAVQIALPAGESRIALRTLGDTNAVRVRKVVLSKSPVLPDSLEVLTAPATVATWMVGPGRVVIDSVNWGHPWEGPADPRRFVVAFLSNLGVSFHPPEKFEKSITVLHPEINVAGGEEHIERKTDSIMFKRNATFEAIVELPEDQDVFVRLLASGTPCGGQFPIVNLQIDGKDVGLLNVNNSIDLSPESEKIRLKAGRHVLKGHFKNYLSAYSEMRVLRVQGFAIVNAQ